jgi:hypothetical protein
MVAEHCPKVDFHLEVRPFRLGRKKEKEYRKEG